MPAGRFIVVEGPDGAGKTTLVDSLAEHFAAASDVAELVREPGGTDVAELLRRELLNRDREFEPTTELLYLATARADLVARRIRPALAAGRIVLSDRFTLSTLAYQGAGRGLPMEQLEWANMAATAGLIPDLTLVLDLDPEIGRSRQESAGKASDRLDAAGAAFRARVAAYYHSSDGPGVRHIDATAPASVVFEEAWQSLVASDPARFKARPEEQRA